MQFVDLKTQYAELKDDIDARIAAVLGHGQYINGPEVVTLETALAAYVDVAHCIGVSSGTDALLIALMAAGIGPGDEVITTPFTFIATGEVIALIGATPVFVDIDPETLNIDPEAIAQAVTANTRAIMPVDLFGQCADYDAIEPIAMDCGAVVIEDAAQAFGARYKGRRAGSLARIACTSFFPSKPLGCYGDGGACFTDDDALARRMREIRVHGQDRPYNHPVLGINGRLDSIQAAILLAKLPGFEAEVEARARIGQRYSALIDSRGSAVQTPRIASYNDSVYAQYTVQVCHRDAVSARLKAADIPTAVHYPVPLHRQGAFVGRCRVAGELAVAEAAAERVLSLPMHPYLEDGVQDRIVAQLSAAVDPSADE